MTTATFPFTLKSEEKSWILMSSMMEKMNFVRYELKLLGDSYTLCQSTLDNRPRPRLTGRM